MNRDRETLAAWSRTMHKIHILSDITTVTAEHKSIKSLCGQWFPEESTWTGEATQATCGQCTGIYQLPGTRHPRLTDPAPAA